MRKRKDERREKNGGRKRRGKEAKKNERNELGLQDDDKLTERK